MRRETELLLVFIGSWFMVGGVISPSVSGLLEPLNALKAAAGAAVMTAGYYLYLERKTRD